LLFADEIADAQGTAASGHCTALVNRRSDRRRRSHRLVGLHSYATQWSAAGSRRKRFVSGRRWRISTLSAGPRRKPLPGVQTAGALALADERPAQRPSGPRPGRAASRPRWWVAVSVGIVQHRYRYVTGTGGRGRRRRTKKGPPCAGTTPKSKCAGPGHTVRTRTSPCRRYPKPLQVSTESPAGSMRDRSLRSIWRRLASASDWAA
jgi:hypothetical protein